MTFQVYDFDTNKWLDTMKSGIVSIYAHDGSATGADYYDGKSYTNVAVFARMGERMQVFVPSVISEPVCAECYQRERRQEAGGREETA